MVAFEAVAEVIGEVRIQECVRHHPQELEPELLGINTGSERGGTDQIGEDSCVVLAQWTSCEAVTSLTGHG